MDRSGIIAFTRQHGCLRLKRQQAARSRGERVVGRAAERGSTLRAVDVEGLGYFLKALSLALPPVIR